MMYTCSSFLHLREQPEIHTVTAVDRSSSAAVLSAMGCVVVAGACPRIGDRCIVASKGMDAYWGVPVVELTRLAQESLFEEEDGGVDYMIGVVEDAAPGMAVVGGRRYETDESLTVGQKIAYSIGPDGELELVRVLEAGVRCTPTVIAWSRQSGDLAAQANPRERYGVAVARTGDVFEVRMVGRYGYRPEPGKDLETRRLANRMGALGAQLSREDDQLVWRIDMSKPFTGDQKEGWVALVHLATWIKDATGSLPEIFKELRGWVTQKPADRG